MPLSVSFGQNIRILDCGSGSGAVALGTFDLFSNDVLNGYNIHFHAIDRNDEALARQECLLRQARYLNNSHTFSKSPVDISDLDKLREFLSSNGSWDIIFFANSLAEIEENVYQNIIALLPPFLKNNGSIIIAEPSQDRGKVIIHKVAPIIQSVGLYSYYPCSLPSDCPYFKADNEAHRKCWQWRKYPEIKVAPLTVAGNRVSSRATSLDIVRIMLNRNGCRFDTELSERRPDLHYGIVRKNRKFNHCVDICPSLMEQQIELSVPDGTIIGREKSHPHGIVERYEI